MRVILAEKPSVATALALAVGATTKRNGYWEGNGYQVTNAVGHLVELIEPDDYKPEWKKWDLNQIPMIPDFFKLQVVDDDGRKKQFGIVKDLFQGASEIICATDAAREGELIFRNILALSGVKNKPMMRLWISSMTAEAIKSGFASMKPLSAYDNLYKAAKCRAEADWLLGNNASRIYSIVYSGKGGLSVGRVMTPVLAMITKRDVEISNFVIRPFWEVASDYKGVTFKYTGGRFEDESQADSFLKKLTGDFVVTDVVGKPEKALPPLLYDLTDLQKDLNVRFGFTAQKTLDITQGLYEKKCVTYPRTDSRYLTSDMNGESQGVLVYLREQFEHLVSPVIKSQMNPRYFNNDKVADHHAIIPTKVAPSSLSHDESIVYEAIVTRFISAFYPAFVKRVTTVLAKVNGESFKASGTVIEELGWRVLYKDDDSKEKEKAIPNFAVGESGSQTPKLIIGKTTPPKAFTEATLLAAMETAGKDCENEEQKEALKERGLGTPATRANTLEKLKAKRYVELQGRNIVSTENGRKLVGFLQGNKVLTLPELTGDWEVNLKAIEKGQYSATKFMSDVIAFVGSLKNGVQQCDASEKIGAAVSLGACPVCKTGGIVESAKAFGCNRYQEGCKFTVWKNTSGKTITQAIVLELLKNGKTKEMQFMSKDNKPYSGILIIDDGKVNLLGVVEKLGSCPVCKTGAVTDSLKSFGCNAWKAGCKFTVWKETSGKKISSEIVVELLKNGKTKKLDGFMSKEGKPYSGVLVITGDGKVMVEKVKVPLPTSS